MTKVSKSTIDKPKRVKVTLACVICRKRKVKCDGNKPSCSRCESMGITCEFSDPPRKRGPPKHNIEVIENRAHRIESLLGKDSHYLHSSRNRIPSSLSPSSSATPSPSLSPSPSPPTSSSGLHRSYHLPSANSLLNLVIGAVEALKDKWRADCMLTGGPMTSLIKDTLPQRFKLLLSEKYFANFNLLLPVLSRHHYLHKLVHQPDDLDPLLCYAVCAMGSRYLEHRDDMERLYFERCLLLFEKLKSAEPTISSVQGVIIMCWYTFMMGDFKKCACLRRHLVDYVRRLNLGINADPSLSIVQTEQRRRTFWVIYVTDAWFSFYTDARLINMTKEGWDCKKPILEDSQLQAIDSRNLKWELEQPPQILQQDETTEAALQIPSFVELIHLAAIVGDMFDYLRSPSHHRNDGQRLESQLSDWFRHLPSYLEYGKADDDDNTPAPVAKTIRILYHTVQIMMHQSPILELDNYNRNTICNKAAAAIIHVAGQMLQQQDELKLYNTFTMSITLATSVHLEAVMTEQQPEEGVDNKDRLGQSIRVLKDANCSYLMHVDFDRLVDRFLTNRCGLTLDDKFKSSQQLVGMWHILHHSKQSLTPEQQRQLLSHHPYHQQHNDNTTVSPPYSAKSVGSMEPIILSEPFLSTSSNAQNLDIDGLLNDSMTDLIFGDGNGFDNSAPSSTWAAYVSNNHTPPTAVQAGNDTASAAAMPNTVNGTKQDNSNIHQQVLPIQAVCHYQQPSLAEMGDMQAMDSPVSSVSPPSSSIQLAPPSSDQDNYIRLLPASTLLPAIHHPIT